MDKLVNKMFKQHFDHVRKIKWVNFDLFASECKEEIKENITWYLSLDRDTFSLESAICQVISYEFDPGAHGGIGGRGDFIYKIPKTVIFEYKLNKLGCVADISVLKQMKKITLDTSPKELLEIYNRIKDEN